MSDLKSTVYARLEAIAAAEKITRVELSELSREALFYVPETQDIDLINRLVGVLTPMNRKTAILFFTEFLPWEVEEDAEENFVRFGKKSSKLRVVKRHMDKIKAFLAKPENNIWTWAGENITIEQKEVSGVDSLDKAIKAALAGKESKTTVQLPISKQQVAETMLANISIGDLMAAVEAFQAKAEETPGQVAEEAPAEEVKAA